VRRAILSAYWNTLLPVTGADSVTATVVVLVPAQAPAFQVRLLCHCR
jgi:hypothetical protein